MLPPNNREFRLPAPTGCGVLPPDNGEFRSPALAGCRCAHPCRPSGTTARS
jgi:hypothetical protein